MKRIVHWRSWLASRLWWVVVQCRAWWFLWLLRAVAGGHGMWHYFSPSWCSYPFEPSAVGYCWSWAKAVDKGTQESCRVNVCPGCELFRKEM